MNKIVADLNRGAATLARRAGFTCGLEVLGSFLVTGQEREAGTGLPLSPKKVTAMGATAKLPTVATLADVDRLQAAVVDVADIQALRADCRAAAAEVTAEREAVRAALTEADEPASRSGRRPELVPTGDKWCDTCTAISRAMAEARFRPGQDEGGVLERAHQLYVEAGMGDANQDASREARFAKAAGYMASTFDEAKAGQGKGKCWFPAEHVEATEQRIRSVLAAHKLDKINAVLSAGHKPLISYRLLSVVFCTFDKDIATSAGQVPASALAGMARHFGLTGYGSTIAAAVNTLEGLGLVECICRITRKGVCRVWRVLKTGWAMFQGAGKAGARAEAGANAPFGAGRGAEPISLPNGYRGRGEGEGKGASEPWVGQNGWDVLKLFPDAPKMAKLA